MSSDFPQVQHGTANITPAPIAPGQVQPADPFLSLLTQARDKSLEMEAYEEAYNSSIRSINRIRMSLDFLSIAVAIAFLYVQYAIGDKTKPAYEIVGIVGTGFSLLVILGIIWGLIARWSGQVEKKRELASKIHRLLARYQSIRAIAVPDAGDIQDWLHDAMILEEERNHEMATTAHSHYVHAHQHVAKRHLDVEVRCHTCNRAWKPEFANQTGWSWISYGKCKGCGVKL